MKRDVAKLITDAAQVIAYGDEAMPPWIQQFACGNCFEWAAKTMMDESLFGKKTKKILVHASVGHPKMNFRYAHGWYEEGGKCYDWQTIVNDGDPPVSKTKFYKEKKPKKIKRYTWEEARKMLVKHETWGPWHNI